MRSILKKLLLLTILCLVASCGKEKMKYLTNGPFYLKGLKQVNADNLKGAEQSFLKDISFNKSYAGHLQLIFIYEDLKQYPQLLFHCDEYLQKAPENDTKIQLVEGCKAEGEESYYLRLNGLLGNKQTKELTEREKLYRKLMVNARREQMKLQRQLKQTKVVKTPSATQKVKVETKPVVKPAKATTKVAMRTYIVAKGDSLSKISKTVYGSVRHWKKIQAANSPVLDDPGNLKIGQSINIPVLK